MRYQAALQPAVMKHLCWMGFIVAGAYLEGSRCASEYAQAAAIVAPGPADRTVALPRHPAACAHAPNRPAHLPVRAGGVARREGPANYVEGSTRPDDRQRMMTADLPDAPELASLSRAHLDAHLCRLESRVQLAVAQRRAPAPDGADPRLRGLYLTPLDIDRLFDDSGGGPPVRAGDDAELDALDEAARDAGPAASRLVDLVTRFGLEPVEFDLLLIAMAPDLDARYERFYGFLHDDVGRRRASVGLAMELAGCDVRSGPDRARLSAGGRLVDRALIEICEPERPFLTRVLRVPDRVTAFLLGDDGLETELRRLVHFVPGVDHPAIGPMATSLRSGSGLIFVMDHSGGSGTAVAVGAAVQAGCEPLVLDARRMVTTAEGLEVVIGREAGLRDGVVVAGPIESIEDVGLISRLAELPVPVVLVGSQPWDPRWSRRVPLVIDLSVHDSADTDDLWSGALAAVAGSAPAVDLREVTRLRLAPAQIWNAAVAASIIAQAHGREMTTADVLTGALRQNGAGLARLARRVEPAVASGDLVLPDSVHIELRELTDRWRHRRTVLAQLPPTRRRGVVALFAGPPGTGKTMAAESVAGSLGLELYVINLATVVDKYIGETEKNLERIFTEAEQVNSVLMFDEADALFGKRSEVRDARDRYANIEVSYLLQRLERFDGLAVLATNLKSNVDEAFARRLDVTVDFPQPDAAARRQLWMKLTSRVPLAPDVDVDFLVHAFEFSGGNIRNVVAAASAAGAANDAPVSMAEMISSVAREYRKLGRLCLPSEFGPWMWVLGGR